MLRLTGDVGKAARMSGVPGRSRGAKFEPYGDEVRDKAMGMARGGASCREIAETLGIGSPDVVRYWPKGGGTKEARMGGRSRRPEGGPEERIRQLELENDILRGDLCQVFGHGSSRNQAATGALRAWAPCVRKTLP
ncbi:hypothetical protein [Slackia isoflavoniconvertens]|uniref:hypothetical protein n=1 Tax=Slackia isoflavoniconvertens TaxID=572010 RepID=UPI003FD8B0F1